MMKFYFFLFRLLPKFIIYGIINNEKNEIEIEKGNLNRNEKKHNQDENMIYYSLKIKLYIFVYYKNLKKYKVSNNKNNQILLYFNMQIF